MNLYHVGLSRRGSLLSSLPLIRLSACCGDVCCWVSCWLPLLLLSDQHIQSLRSNVIKGLNWFFNLKLLEECIKNMSGYIKINIRVIKKWFSAYNLTPCIETLHKILKMCSAMIIIVDYYPLSILVHHTVS